MSGDDARDQESIGRAARTEAESTAAVAAPTRERRWSALARAALPRVARGLATAAVTCLPVGVLAVVVSRGWRPLIQLDNEIIRAATDVTRSHEGFRSFLLGWQEVFLPWHVYLACVPFVVWVWRSGLRARALWGLATMMVGWNIGLQVKLIVERARPVYEDPVSSAPGFSFPSGHAFNAAMATATVLVMVWPLLQERSRWVRVAAVGTGLVITLATALDRVYLGVHFPSDVTAGMILAAALTASSYVGFRAGPRRTD